MTITVYGIANCDTVRRARAWLDAAGVTVSFHDFKRDGLPESSLDRWIAVVGCERLLNRKGTTWRRLDDAARATADSTEGAAALMLALPSLVKRPVVEWADGRVSVGFDPEYFSDRLRGA